MRRLLLLALLFIPWIGFGQVTNGTFTYSSSIDPITNLYAEFTYPTNTAGPWPVLVMQHGYGGGADSIDSTVRTAIATNGIAVFAFGLRGRNGADGAGSEGDGSGREIYDIIDGLAFVRAHFNVTQDAYILGLSGGGGNVLNVACKAPDLFNACIDYFGMSDYGSNSTPYTDPVVGAVNGHGWYYQIPGDQTILNSQIGNPAGGTSVTNRYWSRDAANAIGLDMKGGWLFNFHQEVDSTVPYDQSIQLTNTFYSSGNPRISAYHDHTLYEHKVPDATSPTPYMFDGSGFWISAITNGVHPRWSYPDSGSARVLGFMVNKLFSVWLDEGTNQVADISWSNHVYTVTPLTGTMTVTLSAYNHTVVTNISTATSIQMLNPSTWYIDSAAGAGTHSGTSWANAWTNLYEIAGVLPGDTIEISGGDYTNLDMLPVNLPWGTNDALVTLKHSRDPAHNGLAHITVPLGLEAFSVIDGAIQDNYQTNIVSTWDVSKVPGNCGIFFDGTRYTNQNVMGLGGFLSTQVDDYDKKTIYTNGISWCIFAPLTADKDTSKLVRTIASNDRTNCAGFHISYCYITNVAEYCLDLANSTKRFGAMVADHIDYEYNRCTSTGSLVSGSKGWDVHHCLLNNHPLVEGGENEVLNLTTWWRVYDNVFYPGGVHYIQCYLTDGTNYDHCFFYGNLLCQNRPDSLAMSGAVDVQMNTETVDTGNCQNGAWMSDLRWFNNTAICVTNGANGVIALKNKDWALATCTNLGMYAVPAGLLVYNNFQYSPDNSSTMALEPDYSGFAGCTNGCGFGQYNGYAYDASQVLVDYNVVSVVAYVTNGAVDGLFQTADFNAYSGFAHNTTNQPTMNDMAGFDFRPVSGGAGLDLSSYATNMPGLLTDLNGVARGSVNGTWAVGALEPGGVDTLTNGLICHLTFDEAWDSTNRMEDTSGHGLFASRFGEAGSDRFNYLWPERAVGHDGTGYAAQFHGETNWTEPYFTGDEAGYHLAEYAGITNNISLLESNVVLTISVWAKYGYAIGSNEVNDGVSALLDGGFTSENCWTLGRLYDDQTSFTIRTNLSSTLGHIAKFPDFTTTGSTTNWHNYVAVVNCTNHTLNLYFDGTNCSSTTLEGNISYVTIDPNAPWMALGCWTHSGTPAVSPNYPTSDDQYPNNGWAGEPTNSDATAMDDLKMWARDLSATEVAANYYGTNSGGGGGDGPVTDIWLTEASNANPWPGTSALPFFAGDSNEFTAILSTNYPNVTFHYAAGTYQIFASGSGSPATAHDGCKHLGSGVGQTIIQQAASSSSTKMVLFNGSANGFELHDMTLDCNASNTYAWAHGGTYAAPANIAGSGIRASNVTVLNWGSDGGLECGGFYVYNSEDCVIDGCSAYQPAAFLNGGAAFSINGYGRVLSTNLLVKNCSVTNMPYLTQCYWAPTVTNCNAVACDGNAVYIEPGWTPDYMTDFLVVSNHFLGVRRGISIAYPALANNSIGSLSIIGNSIKLNCATGGITSAFYSDPGSGPTGGGITNFSFSNNTITETAGCGTYVGLRPMYVNWAKSTTMSGNTFNTPQTEYGPLEIFPNTMPTRCFTANMDGNGASISVTNTFSGGVLSQSAASTCTAPSPKRILVKHR